MSKIPEGQRRRMLDQYHARREGGNPDGSAHSLLSPGRKSIHLGQTEGWNFTRDSTFKTVVNTSRRSSEGLRAPTGSPVIEVDCHSSLDLHHFNPDLLSFEFGEGMLI
jgi:hypothetical protein